MINVGEICAPTAKWVRDHGGDTPEQEQLRSCLIRILEGLDPVDQIRIGGDLVNLMRDQLTGLAADVRKAAARDARTTMKPAQIAAASGQTSQTIARLLVRGKAREEELEADVA